MFPSNVKPSVRTGDTQLTLSESGIAMESDSSKSSSDQQRQDHQLFAEQWLVGAACNRNTDAVYDPWLASGWCCTQATVSPAAMPWEKTARLRSNKRLMEEIL